MLLLRLAPAMVAGLWASTVLPGVGLGGGALWAKAGTLLGAAAVSGLIWLLFELVSRLPELVKKRSGTSIKITTRQSLAFVFPTQVLPIEADVEVSGPRVDALGRVLLALLKIALVLAIFPSQFWVTVWVSGELGLAFTVAGFWSVVGGSLIANVIYATLAGLRITRRPVAS